MKPARVVSKKKLNNGGNKKKVIIKLPDNAFDSDTIGGEDNLHMEGGSADKKKKAKKRAIE